MNKIFDDIYILLKDVFKGTIFEGHAFFVGGCVRDYINDLNPNDIDIVIDLKNESKSFCDILHSKLINTTTEPFQLGHYPIYSIKFTKDFHYNEKFLKLNDISIEVAESMSERFNNNDSRIKTGAHGYYWMRSPYLNNYSPAYRVYKDGHDELYNAYDGFTGIAPMIVLC
jgi:hypothetical protein